MFLSSKQSTVSHYSSIGTVAFFPSDYVATLDNDAFVINNMQPSNMQSEHCIKIANFCHELYFKGFLGRASFPKQQYKQMMPEPLQSHRSACGFYAIYAAFDLFKFQQEEINWVHDVNLL